MVYSLRRTFGKKQADDEFLLVRKDTNVECDDFSCDIGEELFKIDAQSFERTVFIGQSDCVTATTDSINAKIGNLADNTDDINNFAVTSKNAFKNVEYEANLFAVSLLFNESDFNMKVLNMSNYLLKQVLDYNIAVEE